MGKRPISVTIIGLLYILSGSTGIIYHLSDPFIMDSEHILVLIIRLLAIIGGIFVLRRSNWARWLLIIWITYHLVLSMGHEVYEMLMHLFVLILTAYCLFQPNALEYFRNEVRKHEISI